MDTLKAIGKPLQEMTNEELWTLFPILLSEHQSSWKEFYREEEKVISTAIGKERIARINHIGSTSVTGLIAKPTIDILLEIRENTDIQFLTAALLSLEYICNAQPNNPAPHLTFMKGYTPRGFEGQAVHLHVRFAGDWDELYFRDYLQSHPDMANEYGKLKQNLKEQFERDRDGYTHAKTDFIQRAISLAREEFGSRYIIQSTSL